MEMRDYLLQWAYSGSKEQREQILEDMRIATQSSSLTTTDPDKVLKVEVAQHYVKSVTNVSTMVAPPAASQSDGNKAPSAIEWLKSAKKPTQVSVKLNGGKVEVEREVNPHWLLADVLENMYENQDMYTNCAQCGKVISLANGGRYPRKFCSDSCRKRDYRQNKKKILSGTKLTES